ncbi:MAG: pilus assembly protein PilM [Verrucomicrobiota bacterium]
MAVPFLTAKSKKRDQIVAIDLGTRTTKAVSLQRKGERYSFASFVLVDAPVFEKKLSPELLGEHLKNVMQLLGAKTRQVIFGVGVNDALVRHAELPQVPVSDMRMMLKFNAKNYLQQDFTDYVFDCQILVPQHNGPATELLKPNQKFKVLVGAAKRAVINELVAAAKIAGLFPTAIIPGILGPVNAFEAAQPDIFSKDVVALVDIGFRSSTISILFNGELILNRVVGIGADRLTSGLADSMSISYAEAEGIKIGMPEEVQAMMQPLLSPLGRELRASIDFFEHQHDKAVGHVFVSGGSARSDFVLQNLQTELMVSCKSWNPANFLELALPPKQMSEVEQISPQLAAVIGAAITGF